MVGVIYTYAIIIQAVIVTQASERWCADEKIDTLMFSSKWVITFLNRANMRRSKITTDDKVVPTDEEITRIMNIGQQMYKDYGHTKDTTINMDDVVTEMEKGSRGKVGLVAGV